jgi:thymidine kinase
MFSGKTDELIRRFEAGLEAGRAVVALKPARDNRYAADLIVSHSAKQIPAVSVASAEAIPAAARASALVLIDEIQFFGEALQAAVAELRAEGSEVVAVGLDYDFRGLSFATTRDLAAGALRVTRLTAVCGLCQSGATLTQRFSDGRPVPLDDPRLVVGDREIYEPRCERCWREEREDDVRPDS